MFYSGWFRIKRITSYKDESKRNRQRNRLPIKEEEEEEYINEELFEVNTVATIVVAMAVQEEYI